MSGALARTKGGAMTRDLKIALIIAAAVIVVIVTAAHVDMVSAILLAIILTPLILCAIVTKGVIR